MTQMDGEIFDILWLSKQKIMNHATCELNSGTRRRALAFTLIELLVVIAIIALLAAMLLPALSMAKLAGQRIYCKNNLKQLAISFTSYNADYKGVFPPRNGTNRWPQYFYPYYKNLSILICPTDAPYQPKSGSDPNSNNIADFAPRTYMINGFNDYFYQELDSNSFPLFMNGVWSEGMPENKIFYPSDTIIFGEKLPTSSQYYMDLLELSGATGAGNDWTELNQVTHMDGSDYLFFDGGARSLRPYLDLGPPVNLWAITTMGRTNFATQTNS